MWTFIAAKFMLREALIIFSRQPGQENIARQPFAVRRSAGMKICWGIFIEKLSLDIRHQVEPNRQIDVSSIQRAEVEGSGGGSSAL